MATTLVPGNWIVWRCNICGRTCRTVLAELGREKPSCPGCSSTVRMRAIIHLLSSELFGRSVALPDFPKRKDLHGMGLSDWDGYAIRLAEKLDYKNTYYHKEPKLDITSIEPALEGTLDFLISTDVFEHIPPPISVAFENARKLLKRSGALVFTVPYTNELSTVEHFPDLFQYELVEENGHKVLNNTTRAGEHQVFRDLVFHGGEGWTLEMRVFSEAEVMKEFARVGLRSVTLWREPCMAYGIYWAYAWSLPITARLVPEPVS